MAAAETTLFRKTSVRDFWQSYGVLLLLFCLAQVCDGASTIYFLLTDPSAEELHPAIAWAVRWFGPIAGPLLGIVGKVLAGLSVAWYLQRLGRLGPICLFLAGSLLSFWAAWYNVWGVDIYTPRLLHWLTF